MTALTMHSGDSKVIQYTVQDSDGNAVDITGATVKWWLAKNSNATALVEKLSNSGSPSEIVFTDPTNGVFQVLLDPADTASLHGLYHRECQLTEADGTVSTIDADTHHIKRDAVT